MSVSNIHRAVIPSPGLLRFLRHQAGVSTLLRRAARLDGKRVFSVEHRHQAAPSKEVKLLPPPRSGPHATQQTPAYDRDLHYNPSSRSTSVRRSSWGESSKRPLLRRLFSSTQAPSIWGLFWAARKKGEHHGQRRKLPPLASFLDDNHSPGRVLKATNEPRLRCTEFDENGNVTLVNGEFKKSELIAKYGLLPRDLRKIDASLLPHILVRQGAILVNLLHLRVLIKHNRVLVFDAYGSTDSYTQSVFMYDLEGKLRQLDSKANGSLPYELRALEAVLISVTAGLESEFEGVREPVVSVLRELEEDIDRDKLRYLLIYSKKLGTFEQKARLVRGALDELLEADDDLAAMYLTAKAQGKGRNEQDHSEVELLLESYHKVTEEIAQAAEMLVSNIRNTEEIIRAILDANRNSLMILDLRFTIFTLGIGAGTFIAALYGMNLKNFIEESDLGFWGVSGASAALGVVVLFYGLQRLRRVQRINMWGDCPPNRSTWWAARGMVQQRAKDEKLAALGNGAPALWGLGNGTASAGLGAHGAAVDANTRAESAWRWMGKAQAHADPTQKHKHHAASHQKQDHRDGSQTF